VELCQFEQVAGDGLQFQRPSGPGVLQHGRDVGGSLPGYGSCLLERRLRKGVAGGGEHRIGLGTQPAHRRLRCRPLQQLAVAAVMQHRERIDQGVDPQLAGQMPVDRLHGLAVQAAGPQQSDPVLRLALQPADPRQAAAGMDHAVRGRAVGAFRRTGGIDAAAGEGPDHRLLAAHAVLDKEQGGIRGQPRAQALQGQQDIVGLGADDQPLDRIPQRVRPQLRNGQPLPGLAILQRQLQPCRPSAGAAQQDRRGDRLQPSGKQQPHAAGAKNVERSGHASMIPVSGPQRRCRAHPVGAFLVPCSRGRFVQDR